MPGDASDTSSRFLQTGRSGARREAAGCAGCTGRSAQEPLVILILLLEDADPEIGATASVTISCISAAALTAYLARSDVPLGTREFLADRGVFPDESSPIEVDDALIDTTQEEFGEPAGLGMPEEPESPRESIT